MTHGVFIKANERREMQSLRDAGWSLSRIGRAFDCCRQTVAKHTVGKRVGSQTDARNVYLLRVTQKRPLHERHLIARRFGLADAKSLEVTLSAYRRKLRHLGASRMAA